MHLSKTVWVVISGVTWFVVGIGLLTLGLNFIVWKAQADINDTTSLIARISPIAGGREQAALALIAMSLILGFIKGRFVLVKTVKNVVERIIALDPPLKFSKIYSRKYLALISCMILLGLSMKWLGLPAEVRGFIDICIGSALMNGASAYFRVAMQLRQRAN